MELMLHRTIPLRNLGRSPGHGWRTDVAGNGELGVLGIFLVIAVVLYTVSWTLVDPPGTVPLTATESATTAPEAPTPARPAP
jgi:hypothetical protein